MSKSEMPQGNHLPPCLIERLHPAEYCQLSIFFEQIEELATSNPHNVLERVQKAVCGESIKDAVFVQNFISNFFLAASPVLRHLNDFGVCFTSLEKEAALC